MYTVLGVHGDIFISYTCGLCEYLNLNLSHKSEVTRKFSIFLWVVVVMFYFVEFWIIKALRCLKNTGT